ncbi:hypothetical protein [Klebsiella phage ABTNL-2]|uniref:Uncharacterized protein n=1 Tax=Klebsiella phage ABTNL-2 TaxID=2849097 RepID=A0A8F2F4F6_9CAUD|nr:hypothetical protein [Klebsiella phage ABTNL-2]
MPLYIFHDGGAEHQKFFNAVANEQASTRINLTTKRNRYRYIIIIILFYIYLRIFYMYLLFIFCADFR